jgi:hypothetical protein
MIDSIKEDIDEEEEGENFDLRLKYASPKRHCQ